MSEGTAGTLVSILMVGCLLTLGFVGSFCIKDKIYQKIEKTGEIRIYDDLYKCEYAGKYVTEEKFIPKDTDELPKELRELVEQEKQRIMDEKNSH